MHKIYNNRINSKSHMRYGHYNNMNNHAYYNDKRQYGGGEEIPYVSFISVINGTSGNVLADREGVTTDSKTKIHALFCLLSKIVKIREGVEVMVTSKESIEISTVDGKSHRLVLCLSKKQTDESSNNSYTDHIDLYATNSEKPYNYTGKVILYSDAGKDITNLYLKLVFEDLIKHEKSNDVVVKENSHTSSVAMVEPISVVPESTLIPVIEAGQQKMDEISKIVDNEKKIVDSNIESTNNGGYLETFNEEMNKDNVNALNNVSNNIKDIANIIVDDIKEIATNVKDIVTMEESDKNLTNNSENSNKNNSDQEFKIDINNIVGGAKKMYMEKMKKSTMYMNK